MSVNIEQKILIIDGHPVYIDKLTGFLQGLTFKNIVLARSGKEGLEKSKTEKPDIIILSGMLPDRDSIEICKSVKEILPETKIIVQIGLFTEDSTVERFKESGASCVVPRKEKDLLPLQQQLERLSEED